MNNVLLILKFSVNKFWIDADKVFNFSGVDDAFIGQKNKNNFLGSLLKVVSIIYGLHLKVI